MPLRLQKPIIVFDVESTGLNITRDHIIELSYVKLFPNGERTEGIYRFNPDFQPGEGMDPQAQQVHGITLDELQSEPLFKERAREIAKLFEGSDIAGFNSNHFDIPILMEEMKRAGVPFSLTSSNFVDVQALYHKRERRDLEAAYRFYCGKEMEHHHSASCDAQVTLEVLLAQVDHYEDLRDASVAELAVQSRFNRNVDLAGRMILDDEDQPIFNFGKYKGKRVVDILKAEPGYYGWFMNADFPQDSKDHLTKIKLALQQSK